MTRMIHRVAGMQEIQELEVETRRGYAVVTGGFACWRRKRSLIQIHNRKIKIKYKTKHKQITTYTTYWFTGTLEATLFESEAELPPSTFWAFFNCFFRSCDTFQRSLLFCKYLLEECWIFNFLCNPYVKVHVTWWSEKSCTYSRFSRSSGDIASTSVFFLPEVGVVTGAGAGGGTAAFFFFLGDGRFTGVLLQINFNMRRLSNDLTK